MPISMVDLHTQYLKIKTEVDRGINEVISTTQFVKGTKVEQFQQHLQQYTGARHVIAVGNGTDALQIALLALGLQPGDEVIAPTFTFIATAEVVALLGLKPVLVDVDWDTMNISVDAVRRAITPKTRAIVPVHLFGQCADMEPLIQLAQEHHLFIVEDACQAIGAHYTFFDGHTQQAGTMGQIGCTSFFPSKNLGCYGDGGALFTNDDALADHIRAIANHGSRTRYYHDEIGVNSRLDTIQAAVLEAKLPHLDEYTAARRQAAAYYDRAFSGNERCLIPGRAAFSDHVFHQYTLRLCPPTDMQPADYRDGVRARLAEQGIPAMVYYPVPIHLQRAYRDPRYRTGDFPVAERLSQCVLSLPMHTELSEEQLQTITQVCCRAFNDCH